jgi:hypothetical protein
MTEAVAARDDEAPTSAEPGSDRHRAMGRARASNRPDRLPLPGRGSNRWARRLHDLMALYLSDMGGVERVSEAERAIVRRACTLVIELERLETRFALDGEASPTALDLYQRVSGQLRRLLESIGLQRRVVDLDGQPPGIVARLHGVK